MRTEKAVVFSTQRDFTVDEPTLRRAAIAVIEDYLRSSEPPVSTSVKTADRTIYSGWVYGTSRDKYVEYKYNGAMQRKKLSVRRRYSFDIAPSLAGSQATATIEEEIEKIDLNTGKPESWEGVSADPKEYDNMLRKLKEKTNSQ